MRSVFLSCLFSWIYFAAFAGGIKGKVTSQKNESLPYASISVKGQNTGTLANEDGKYELSLEPGIYDIVFQFLGYQTVVQTVQVTTSFTEINITLEEQPVSLQEARVAAGKEDPAYTIMRKAISKARFHQLQVRSYHAKVYSRTSATINNIPFLLQKRLRKAGIEEGKAFLNESVAEITYTRPKTYKQKILSTRNSVNNNMPSPNEYILASLYSPVVAGTISPLSPKAFNYYKFEYEGYFQDQGRTVNKIKVIPKAYGEGVFKGRLYILEDLWAIHSYDLETTTEGLNIVAKQIFSPLHDVWLPVSQNFKLNGSYLGFSGDFRYLVSVKYQKLDIDPNLKEEVVIIDPKVEEEIAKATKRKGKEPREKYTTKEFRKYTQSIETEERKDLGKQFKTQMIRQDTVLIDPLANKRDSTYWNELRPIPLTTQELKGYRIQDSIIVAKELRHEKPRPDSGYFKVKHIALGNTYALGNRTYFYFKSPIFSISYNTVEANSFYLLMQWRKEWARSDYFVVKPYIRYSFGKDRLYGSLGLERGGKDWMLGVTAGEIADQINQNNPILPFPNSIAGRFFEQNFVKLFQNKFFKAEFNRRNIGDILSAGASIEFQHRLELFNDPTAKSLFFWDSFEYTPNRPENNELSNTGFPVHNAVLFKINGLVTPWRRYIVKNGEKRYLRSRGPSFSLDYKTTIPGLGDVHYATLEGGIRHDMNMGPRNSLSFSVSGGGFVNKKELYFIDYKHFMGNEFFFQMSDRLMHFRMLPYYTYSTSHWFLEGHAVYTMQRFLFTRIEKLRLTGVKETLQIHYLKAPTLRNYTELVYGFDDVLRIGRLEFVGQFQGAKIQSVGFRIGTSLLTGSSKR